MRPCSCFEVSFLKAVLPRLGDRSPACLSASSQMLAFTPSHLHDALKAPRQSEPSFLLGRNSFLSRGILKNDRSNSRMLLSDSSEWKRAPCLPLRLGYTTPCAAKPEATCSRRLHLPQCQLAKEIFHLK